MRPTQNHDAAHGDGASMTLDVNGSAVRLGDARAQQLIGDLADRLRARGVAVHGQVLGAAGTPGEGFVLVVLGVAAAEMAQRFGMTVEAM